MRNNKMGRPTELKKDSVIKARVDDLTIDKLEYCAKKTSLPKSEILRIGIDKVYEEVVGDKNL